MNAITAAIFVLGLFIVTAETTVKQLTSSENVLDVQSQYSADEAVLVGHILRHVASELQHDVELDSETDEYFFRKLWNKTKAAFKKAGHEIKVAYKKAKPYIKPVLKEAGKSAAKAVFNVVKRKAQEKAVEYVTKLFTKAMAGYATEDTGSQIDVVKNICTLMDQEGERLIRLGQKLGAQRFVFSHDQ
ncbi:uncharacterized protein LOC144123184 [Amblyomma americanum]